MITQPSLWDAPAASPKLPRRRQYPSPPAAPGSATSRDAAERMKPHAPTQRELVYEVIRSRGAYGATRQEIADAGFRLQAVCARVAELLHAPDPMIEVTDRRRGGREVLVARQFAGGSLEEMTL